MSAVVCGKRSNIFEDSPSSPPVSKRIRCSPSSSSPGRTFSPPRAAAASNYSFANPVLDNLASLFPDMDRQKYIGLLKGIRFIQFLEKALEESGDDLDSAIKRLNELRLTAAASASDITQEIGAQFSAKGASLFGFARRDVTLPDLWIKHFLARALEALEKSICANATAETAKSFQEENIMLKQQLEALLQENAILKRAVSIQHERQKEFEEMGQELHQLKQLVSQYQEQLRTLEGTEIRNLAEQAAQISFPKLFGRSSESPPLSTSSFRPPFKLLPSSAGVG
ncbi:hypothetical protein DH2020_039359 [Rehmannia glutinosa]|uniref:Uncharacterized protein n=1 Tax=Rehmannia glutinosa TaxID=99300 RepID=A0ABR0UXP7_REHGL